VVLAVMELERLGGDVRLERILRIGQRRKFEGHRILPFILLGGKIDVIKTSQLIQRGNSQAVPSGQMLEAAR
jgi:hypothetical protein